MAEVRDILRYICSVYPQKNDLSKARINKIVYLTDWRSAIQRGRQVTELKWVFNHYGPYLDEVVETALQDPALTVRATTNAYGGRKEVVALVERDASYRLDAEEKRLVDEVIETTSGLYFNAFIDLVYSTYPVVTQPRYTELNLVKLARAYNKTKANLKTN